MKLKDKVCVVTGGAMGNGLGIVKVFLKYGAKVSIIDYDKSVNDVVINLKNDGYNVIGFCADIRDKVSVDEAIKKTREVFGNIDVLVNNAGVAKLETFEEMSDEVRDFHLDINIKGTWNVTKSALTCFIVFTFSSVQTRLFAFSTFLSTSIDNSFKCSSI